MNLTQITQARWFPTLSKPLLSGLVASGVIFGLHACGITNFTSNEVNAAAAPLVGFLVTAIAAKAKADPVPDAPPASSMGHDLAQILLPDLEQALGSNPDLLRGLLLQALQQAERAEHPTQVVVPSAPAAPVSSVLPQDSGMIR